jgi:hypothetical protein
VSRRVAQLIALALVPLATLFGLFWASKHWREPPSEEPQLPLRGGGIVIEWAPPRPTEPGVEAQADPRDYLLKSDRLRLVVGNDGSGMERHQRYGALIDLGLSKDSVDELLELRTVLYVAGNQVPLRMLGVDPSMAGERPVLAVEEGSRDGRFELRTEYRLAPKLDYVELVTTVTNLSGKRVIGVQVGDRGRWPGTTAFAPRLGHVHLATRAEVPWLGRAGKKLTYGFVFPDHPANTAFQFDVVGPAGEVALGPSLDLLPHAAAEHRRDAIVVEGGLGKVAEIAWQRLGKTVGHARGVLTPAQTWASVEARHPDGRTVLSVPVAADGHFELPLPPGDYRFVLQAPGGEDEELGHIPETGGELRLNLVPPRPGTLTYLVTDEQQQPMPSRLVVRGVPPTKDPDLVPAEGEAGTQNMLYSLTGSGQLLLPKSWR